MTSARFKLDMFEGPLDLLLHLINKHKLNICDIEITVLIEQYLDYLSGLDHEDYDDAADFLAMAARLIYIKTVSLLPHDEEAEQLKKELEGRLIEYSLCKQAAQLLKARYIGGDIFVREPVKLPVNKTFTGEKDPMSLLEAYFGMSEKSRDAKPIRAAMFEPIVSKKIYSVTSKIVSILKRLYQQGSFEMDRLYDGMTEKSERVAAFLAVLELTKSGRILLSDDNSVIYMNPDPDQPADETISAEFDEDQLQEDMPEDIPEDAPEEIPAPELSQEEEISRRADEIRLEFHRQSAEPPQEETLPEEPQPETTEEAPPQVPDIQPQLVTAPTEHPPLDLEPAPLDQVEPAPVPHEEEAGAAEATAQSEDQPPAPQKPSGSYRAEEVRQTSVVHIPAPAPEPDPEPQPDTAPPVFRPNLYTLRQGWKPSELLGSIKNGYWRWTRK